MEIIEKIKTNNLDDNLTEIQKICLHKLQSSPLPNPKSELWRLSNKSKLSTFLDYSVNEKDSKFDTPFRDYAKSLPFNPDQRFNDIINGNLDEEYGQWEQWNFKNWKNGVE